MLAKSLFELVEYTLYISVGLPFYEMKWMEGLTTLSMMGIRLQGDGMCVNRCLCQWYDRLRGILVLFWTVACDDA